LRGLASGLGPSDICRSEPCTLYVETLATVSIMILQATELYSKQGSEYTNGTPSGKGGGKCSISARFPLETVSSPARKCGEALPFPPPFRRLKSWPKLKVWCGGGASPYCLAITPYCSRVMGQTSVLHTTMGILDDHESKFWVDLLGPETAFFASCLVGRRGVG
jgi:hypothetical protein